MYCHLVIDSGPRPRKEAPRRAFSLHLSKDGLPLGRSLKASLQGPHQRPTCDSVSESRGREGLGLPSDANL